MLDGHKYCRRGDASFLICHVTLLNLMTKVSNQLIGENHSPLVIDLPSLLIILMLPNKELLFKKFVHPFHSLQITLENSTKVRMTHFNIPLTVNAAEIIR